MAKKNKAVETTVVAETRKLTLAEQLDGVCNDFLGAIGTIMDNAMADTRNARDAMLGAVANYRDAVSKQDDLASIILSVGNAIVDTGKNHVEEVETYEVTLDICDELETEIAELNGEIVDEDEVDDTTDTTDVE